MSDIHDVLAPIAKPLTPANQNPWYVLMTLFGEQEGEEIDWELHSRNRATWNTWACQWLSNEEREKVAKDAKVDLLLPIKWKDIEPSIKKQHQNEWIRRNGASSKYLGFPDAKEVVFCNDCSFKKTLLLDQFVFPQTTRFDRVEFHERVSLNKSVFMSHLIMNNVQMAQDASFDSAQLARGLMMNEAAFRGSAVFSHCKLAEDAWFLSSRFSNAAHFNSASFDANVWFNDAIFESLALFMSARFEKSAHFRSAIFDGVAAFSSVDFNGATNFSGAKFGKLGGNEKVFFAECTFAKPVSFRDARFCATYPDFTGTSLHEKATFPSQPDNWPLTVAKETAEQAKASCAVMRHSIGRQGLPEAEHFFFRREMAFAAQIGGWWQKLPYRLFGLFSEFGYSIARPALWLLGMFFVVGMLNHVVLQWGASMHGNEYHPAQAFALSFSNEFPLFGLQARWLDATFFLGLNPWLKFLGGVQTVFALPLFFFLGLGLRTRFRMR